MVYEPVNNDEMAKRTLIVLTIHFKNNIHVYTVMCVLSSKQIFKLQPSSCFDTLIIRRFKVYKNNKERIKKGPVYASNCSF